MHRIGPGQRAGAVCQLGDAGDVSQRADGVRCDREGDDPGARGKLTLEVGQIDVALVGDVGEADLEAQVVGQLEPRRDVPVVVEAGDDDRLGLESADRRCGRARTTGRSCWRRRSPRRASSREAPGGFAGRIDHAHGPPAGLEGAADVRVGLAEIRRDGVDHLVGHLCPAWPVRRAMPGHAGARCGACGRPGRRASRCSRRPTLATPSLAATLIDVGRRLIAAVLERSSSSPLRQQAEAAEAAPVQAWAGRSPRVASRSSYGTRRPTIRSSTRSRSISPTAGPSATSPPKDVPRRARSGKECAG